MQRARLLDAVRGTLIGVAVGDALAAPHKFRNQRANVYTGKLHIAPSFLFRGRRRTDVIGQYGSATEMTLANVRAMLDDGDDQTVLAYEDWAATARACGKTTRTLFKGVRTLKGYETRYKNLFPDEAARQAAQSNGALTRSALLAFMGEDAVVADCDLSNPSNVARDASRVYCSLIRAAVHGTGKDEMRTAVIGLEIDPQVMGIVYNALDDALREPNMAVRDVQEAKGWVLNALYCALWSFWSFSDYQSAIDAVIRLRGDTTANAAATGGLWGAYLGYDALLSETRTGENITIVRNADSALGDNPLRALYRLDDFDSLTDRYTDFLLDNRYWL